MQTLVVEENARDNQRPGEAPTTRLVRAGDEARPEAPVESKKFLASPAHMPRIEVVVGRPT